MKTLENFKEQAIPSEAERIRGDGHEGKLTDTIKIDVTLIPDHVRDELAAAGLAFVKRTLRQPGGREMLDAKTAARKARQEAHAAAIPSADEE